MIFLIGLIHGIFLTIFILFGRYIEASCIAFLFFIFLIKVIPPIDVLKRPQFLKKEVSDRESLSQSVYFSTGILFYLALIGISISASDYFNASGKLLLFQYCIFFLSSIIFALYLMFYTKSPWIRIIFRTHCIIVGIFLTILSIALVAVNSSIIGFIFMNIIFILFGLLAVMIFDREITQWTYITSLYTFVFLLLAGSAAFLSMIPIFQSQYMFYLFFFGSITFSALYVFLPQFLKRSTATQHISYAIWHLRNSLLGASWILVLFLIYFLFRGTIETRDLVTMSLIILIVFWSWVYINTDRSPLFFTGNILIITALYSYAFFYILPPSFWLLLVCLFIFVGLLLLFSRYFYGKKEEHILALNAVLFMCCADFYFLFSDSYRLFLVSILFFLQSFLWYGVYEIFQRHSYAKKQLL